MGIHQISVSYQLEEDRLLMRLRTHDAQIIELWFTRRLMARLWAPLQRTADQAGLRGLSPGATVLPEAQGMMAQTLRRRSREAADFSSPFDESCTARPLGDRPALVQSVNLHSGGQDRGTPDSVRLSFSDVQGRDVSMDLSPEMLNNLVSLLQEALNRSEWGLAATGAIGETETAASPERPRILN